MITRENTVLICCKDKNGFIKSLIENLAKCKIFNKYHQHYHYPYFYIIFYSSLSLPKPIIKPVELVYWIFNKMFTLSGENPKTHIPF